MRINKVLIANRGEIALRIMKTCKKLGILTVAVYSEADRDALFVAFADEAVCIGPPPASESYLCIDKIIKAAKATKADAIHPGYGFLSENAGFARACADAAVKFIGPSPESIHMLGNKAAVKRLFTQDPHAIKAAIPTIPGYTGQDQSAPTLLKQAQVIGYPVLLKAAAGGGGKGMRVVNSPQQLEAELESVKREAKEAFGSDELLLEKYFTSVRHIEVQIFGDEHGEVIHFGERDCSVQRRYQKVFEETPSAASGMNEIRGAITSTAVTVGKLARYSGAGTVEFLLDAKTNKFYFLEVNTRLQVEHPVTEAVWGLDLVQLQIRVAEGKALKELVPDYFSGKLKPSGHALECRLYAEDPSKGFLPATGRVLLWKPEALEGVRYDYAVTSGSEISVYYDPLIAKVIAYGPDRATAIQRLQRALDHSVVMGPTTNVTFLLAVLQDQVFQSGNYDTGFIGLRFPADSMQALYVVNEETTRELSVVAQLFDWYARRTESIGTQRHHILRNVPSQWSNGAARVQHAEWIHKKSGAKWSVTYGANVKKGRGEAVRPGIAPGPATQVGLQFPQSFTFKVEKEEKKPKVNKNNKKPNNKAAAPGSSGTSSKEKDSGDNKGVAKKKGSSSSNEEQVDTNSLYYSGIRSVEGGVGVTLVGCKQLSEGTGGRQAGYSLDCEILGVRRSYTVYPSDDTDTRELWVHSNFAGVSHLLVKAIRHKPADEDEEEDDETTIHVRSPMPAIIVNIAQEGQTVGKGDVVATLYSMKMEIKVESVVAGKVTQVKFKPKQEVAEGQSLLTIEKQ